MAFTQLVFVSLVVSMAVVTISAELPLAEPDSVGEQHSDNSSTCLVQKFLMLLAFHDGADVDGQSVPAQKHANRTATWKCKPTQAGIEHDAAMYEECYEELIGIPEPVLSDDEPKKPVKPTTDREKKRIEQCIAEKTKIINEDGSINPDKVYDQLKEIEIDDSVKELIEKGLEDCVTKGEKVHVVLECVSKVLIEHCAVSPDNSTNVIIEH